MKLTPIKLTEQQFKAAAEKAGIGKHKDAVKQVEGARLYFVEGGMSIAEAGRRADCHPNNVGAAVRKILAAIDEQEREKNTELVTVRVPRGKGRELRAFAKAMVAGKG